MRFIRRLIRMYHLQKYDDFSISEYFRAQGAQIGERNRIEVRSLGTEPFLIRIGNHCTIASNVKFLTHDGGTWVFTDEYPDLQRFGKIEIKDNCFIGINAILLPGVTIGPNSIVGAGAVVTRDVPPNELHAGLPARRIGSISEYREKVISEWRESQRPPAYFEGITNEEAKSPRAIFQYKRRDAAMLRRHLVALFWGEGGE